MWPFRRSAQDKILVTPEPLWRRRYNRKGILYVLPAMAFFGLMTVYPILRALYLSFFNYSILEPDAARFVGLANYVKLFTQTTNRGPFWNTLYFTVLFVPAYVFGALLIAVMLNRVRSGSTLLRTMIFAPVVVSLAVSSVMFSLLYSPSFGLLQGTYEWAVAAVNPVLGFFGQVAIDPKGGILGEPRTAMYGIVLLCLWNGIGFNVILFLVGLQRIPEEMHEAAAVDGANAWHRFIHITLPQLRPTIYLVLLLSMIGAFKVFGQPFIMTAGGPQDATKSFVLRLYNLAFTFGHMELGYASAMAYSLAAFIFVMSMLVRRLNRSVE